MEIRKLKVASVSDMIRNSAVFRSPRVILLFHDGSAEPAEMKKARLPFRTVTGLCMEVFFWKRKDARQEELSAEHLRLG